MMSQRGAGRSLAGDRDTAEDSSSNGILPTRTRWGNCRSCAVRIDLRTGATSCAKCAAWFRWWSAHRIASQALREAAR